MKLSILFTLLLFFLLNNFQPILSTSTSKAYKKFITSSCSTTTYPSLCKKGISPYASKVKMDPLKLSKYALTTSLQSAKDAYATVSALSKQKSIPKRDAAVIKDCIYNIKDSVNQIKKSITALANIRDSADKKFQLSNIKTYASAAITDEETCLDELGDSKVKASVKKKIKKVIVNFQKTTSNALSLINRLDF